MDATILLCLIHCAFLVKSCSPGWPSNDTLYVGNVQLLDDFDTVLLTIAKYINGVPTTYCKVMNVRDGSTTNVVECGGHNIRSWSSQADTDYASTSITSVNDNDVNDTIDITLQRNQETLNISSIPYSRGISTLIITSLNYFTINSMHSTFLILPYNYPYEIVQIKFASRTNNSYEITSYITSSGWRDFNIHDAGSVSVYQHINTIKLPKYCTCTCSFYTRYSFMYDENGQISNLTLDQSIDSNPMDLEAGRIYQWGSYGQSVIINDMIIGQESTFYPNIEYTTAMPTQTATIMPTNAPTITPTNIPTNLPTHAPSNILNIPEKTTKEVEGHVDETSTTVSIITGVTDQTYKSDASGMDDNLDNWALIGLSGGIILLCVCIVCLCLLLKFRTARKESTKIERSMSNIVQGNMKNKTDGNTNTNTGHNAGESELLKQWLTINCKLPQYYEIFISNGYESLDLIKLISDKSYLEDIGILLKGHQTKLWDEIKKLNGVPQSGAEGKSNDFKIDVDIYDNNTFKEQSNTIR